jgi:anti-sigma B factor antagonist
MVQRKIERSLVLGDRSNGQTDEDREGSQMVREPFEAAASLEGETTFVRVHGELDLATVPSLESEMAPLMAGGARAVVLDLRELDFIDVAGLRLALRLEGLAQLHGVRFALVRGPVNVQRVFELTGMERFVPVIDDPRELAAA